jgi:catechol 2,3-dioxygenase-like lactoylglutathione lyase family enzyme
MSAADTPAVVAGPMRVAFAGVSHMAFTVTDLDASHHFYTEVLDFVVVMDVGYGRICMHPGTGFALTLLRHEGAHGGSFTERAGDESPTGIGLWIDDACGDCRVRSRTLWPRPCLWRPNRSTWYENSAALKASGVEVVHGVADSVEWVRPRVKLDLALRGQHHQLGEVVVAAARRAGQSLSARKPRPQTGVRGTCAAVLPSSVPAPFGPWVSTNCGTGNGDIQWQRPPSRRPKES